MPVDDFSKLEEEIIRDSGRAAKHMVAGAKKIVVERGGGARKPTKRSDELNALEIEMSNRIRRNVNAIMEVEKGIDDGLTRYQLGLSMGLSGNVIYTYLKEGDEPMGMLTLCRLSLALGIDPQYLVLQHPQFKKVYLESYRSLRLRGEQVAGRTAKKGK